ncbi:MAG TPA: hypothetical protein VIG69_02210 [Candidatus Methylomirabilis sp.]|jgi:hypothetical protein
MARTKGKKPAGKRSKKIDVSKVRIRDLGAKRGKIAGGGLGGFGGFSGGSIKKA